MPTEQQGARDMERLSPRQTTSGQHSPALSQDSVVLARHRQSTAQRSTAHPGTAPTLPRPAPTRRSPRPDSAPARCGPLRSLGRLPSGGTRRGRQAPSPPKEDRKVWFGASAGVLLTRPLCMSQPGDAGHTLNANAAGRSGLASGFTVPPAANLQHFCSLPCPQPRRCSCPRHGHRRGGAGACGVPGQRAVLWLRKPPATCPGPWEHAARRAGGLSSDLGSAAAGLCDLASRVWQAARVIWT